MATKDSDRIWNNMVSIVVCDQGYEWHNDPRVFEDQPEPKLYPRFTELVPTDRGYNVQQTNAKQLHKFGASFARGLVPALRDLAERLDWLLLDPIDWQYEARIARTRRSLFTSKEHEAIGSATRRERIAWARSLVAEFAGEYGMLTSDPETLSEWHRALVSFRGVDRLCTAIKRHRWGDVDECMHNNGTVWIYIDAGIIEQICTKGDYSEMADGSRQEWWSIAGRTSERARMAFAKIISKKLTSALSVSIDRLRPSEGVLTPNDLLSSGYFMLWRSIASPDYDRYCEFCDDPIPSDKRAGTRFCSDVCKQANYRVNGRYSRRGKRQPIGC